MSRTAGLDSEPSFKFSSAVGPNWPGIASVKKLVVFGASYCSVGYTPESPHPSLENPLGVEFPGRTYAGGLGDLPNWVGHLVLLRKEASAPLIVYDYAAGGHTARDVRDQVNQRFLPTVGEKPDWAPWDEEDTLFVTWVGINDCARSREHGQDLNVLFDAQEALYKAGARNFMYIDVPPVHRLPAVHQARRSDPDVTKTFDNWNANLHRCAGEFLSAHPDATILLYSSWTLFNTVLDNPTAYGFFPGDVDQAGGAMWMDRLHPTSDMHKVIAQDMEKFLLQFPAFVKVVGEVER